MEFPFDVKSLFPGNINVVDNYLNVQSLDVSLEIASNVNSKIQYRLHERSFHDEKSLNLIHVINLMGVASGRAQNLQYPITSAERLQQKGDQSLYVILDSLENGDARVVGILKMGRKKLFVVDALGKLNDADTLCVMDFYVHESQQRRGFGKRLFDAMLKNEKVVPRELAIDRPSSKFVSFLCKHYDLRDMIAQPNNFAVFPGFFSRSDATEVKGKAASNQRHSYAGSDTKIDAEMLFRKALKTASARPRSLNDIERTLKWSEEEPPVEEKTQNGEESNIRNGSPGDGKKDLKANGTSSPFVQEALVALNKRRSFHSGHNHSTSWNLFGVPPPTYTS